MVSPVWVPRQIVNTVRCTAPVCTPVWSTTKHACGDVSCRPPSCIADALHNALLMLQGIAVWFSVDRSVVFPTNHCT